VTIRLNYYRSPEQKKVESQLGLRKDKRRQKEGFGIGRKKEANVCTVETQGQGNI
jgi:hypothetical protein